MRIKCTLRISTRICSGAVLIPGSSSFTNGVNLGMFLYQFPHETHHLVTVQMGELTDVSVRQAGFSPVRPLLKRTQYLCFCCLPFSPPIALRQDRQGQAFVQIQTE
jgi:hypothetical protein